MESIKRFFETLTVRRFFILTLIVVLLFSIRDMLNLVLLTFLIAYIMNSLQHMLTRKLSKYIAINSKFIIILLYLALVTIVVFAIIN